MYILPFFSFPISDTFVLNTLRILSTNAFNSLLLAAARAAARAARMEEAKLRAAEQREQGERKKVQPKRDETREPTTEAGRVDDRPYAKGRSYQADRYDDKE